MLAVPPMLAILLATAVVRAATEHVPALRVRATLPSALTIPGPSPKIAWPREGQAAVEVEGVGSFGASGASSPAPIASAAKVMTAYLTLREHPLSPGQSGFTMTVTPAQVTEERRRAAVEESVVPVKAGERLSERQALLALMLPSGNNIAAMLAVHDAGSVEAFVARMNAQARALGMRSTTYTDPSGFKHSTVSTATDQLKLAEVAMRNPTFASIVDQPAARLPVAGMVFNYNSLVGQEGYVGVKTGSDGAAGGCLVFAKRISVSGHRFLVLGVVLGQRGGEIIQAALASARRLGNSAAAALRPRTVLPAGSRVLAIRSVDGSHAAARTSRPLREIGWPGLRVPVTVTIAHRGTSVSAGEDLASVQTHGPLRSRVAATTSRPLATTLSLGWRLAHLL